MSNRKKFFDSIRLSLFDGKLRGTQVFGIEAILDEWEAGKHKDIRRLAYLLGTAHHETDRTMQPIEEYGKGRGRKYGKRLKMNGRPYTDYPHIYYGRGYVQLTWYENYDKAGKKLELDLLHDPLLAMMPPVAAKILILGSLEGWFTGRKLSDYFNGGKADWVNARRIINGLDKANLVAWYAKRYYAALKLL